MKKSKKLIALLVAAVMITGSVIFAPAALNITPQDYSASPNSTLGTRLPLTGFGAIDSEIRAWVDRFSAANAAAFDADGDSVIIEYSVTDDSDRYSKLEVKVSLASSSFAGETRIFYIDTSNGSLLADEAAYNAALAAEAEEAEAEEEPEAAAEEEEEEVSYVEADIDYDQLLPLRSICEDFGLTVEWNSEFKAVEILDGDGNSLVILFVGSDGYITGDDEVIELGVAPQLIDGVTYVPLSFFVYILGIDPEDLGIEAEVVAVAATDDGGSSEPEAPARDHGSIMELSRSLPYKNEDGSKQAGWSAELGHFSMQDVRQGGYWYLVLEFDAPPTGGLDFVWQSTELEEWWNQTRVIPDNGWEESYFVIDLSTINGYSRFRNVDDLRMLICYYSEDLSDLGLRAAYLATKP